MKRTYLKLLVAALLSLTFTTHAANILYIIDSINAAGKANLALDREVVDYLTAKGHTVTLADDQDAALDSFFAGQDLIMISSSVGSGNQPLNSLSSSDLVTRKLPIICSEPGLYDEFKFQTATAFGNAAGHTSLAMSPINQSHPLAAGKSGLITLVNPGTTAVFGSSGLPINVGTDAIIIATNGTPGVDEGRLAIWAYEAGSRLVDNSTVVPARRVAFFFNATTAAGVYNTDAYDLFFAAVNWALGTGTSGDKTPPTMLEAKTAGNANGLLIVFSEPVSPSTATNKANYAIDNGVTVNSAQLWQNNYTVLLSTIAIAPGRAYQLTVNGVQDTAPSPNTIAANSKMQFFQVDGIIERRVFLNIAGTTVANLTNAAAFTSNQPDFVTYPTLLEGPVNSGAPDNYGTQFRGYVTAPVTGAYTFYICSDDLSSLYLSTDDQPANKKLIATETAWSNSRQWVSSAGNSDLSSKRSDLFPNSAWPTPNAITLTAGKRYYIEVLHKEGGGGDDIAVTWTIPGGTDPVDGDLPIPGRYLSAFGFTSGPVTVTTAPTNKIVLEPGSATFTVSPGGTPPYSYQWLSNGVAVAGATSQSFTLPIARRANNGDKISVQVSNPFSTTTSSAATLSVTPDTTPPKGYQVNSVDAAFRVINLSFNELMDPASAQTAANYSFAPGNIVATNAVLDATGTNVTVTTGKALTPGTNILTFTGIKDLAGNAVSAGTSLTFMFKPVTYADNILFDQPLAYYQFEETSGSVAKNAGSTGGDGTYYVTDEPSAGAGGIPSAPKGDPGPRPPTFAGFDASNRSATFGGPNFQDWVDTKNQFLQGLRAFTLEYWVKPANRVSDAAAFGSRIGIVGQNDAVEYGFISATQIQIWTPNGGNLTTTYSSPDNEWHHVATIANGTSLTTYYDGVLIGTGGSATSSYGTSTYNVHIGGGGVFDVTGNYFTGNIDEVAIFNKAIPAARVLAHYQAGKSGGVLVSNPDVTPQTVVQALEGATLNQTQVSFSKVVDSASAQNSANYSLAPIAGGAPLTITAAVVSGGTTVVLTTSPRTAGTAYALTVKDVKDLTGSTVVPNPSVIGVTSMQVMFTFTDSMVWTYNRAGLDLGTAWQAPKYDDSKWEKGVQPIGDNADNTESVPIRTVISRNNDAGVHITTLYVRGHFNFPGTSTAGVKLAFKDMIDDGAVFYLNGVEVRRLGIAAGLTFDYNTFFADHGEAITEGPFDIPAGSLVPGDNVFAVEVHQTSATSSDIVFGAELVAFVTPQLAPSTRPILSITRSGSGATITWTPTGGTLQTTSSLSGTPVWTDVGTANPATINIGNAAAFYRVKSP